MADFRDQTKNMAENAGSKARQGAERAADAGHRATQAASGVIDQAKDAAQGAVNTVTEFAGRAGDRAQEWMGNAGDSARQFGHQAQRFAGDAMEYTSEHFKDFGGEMTSMIRKYPIPAVLIGLGVGLLLGRSARS